MTNQGHFESAAYMVRNLITGDDEQTRIEDEWFHEELPKELADACKYLVSNAGAYDYDGAILIYVRWHLLQVVSVWFHWKEDQDKMWNEACLATLERMGYEKPYTPEDLEQITDWTEGAKNILKGGC